MSFQGTREGGFYGRCCTTMPKRGCLKVLLQKEIKNLQLSEKVVKGPIHDVMFQLETVFTVL